MREVEGEQGRRKWTDSDILNRIKCGSNTRRLTSKILYKLAQKERESEEPLELEKYRVRNKRDYNRNADSWQPRNQK